jgi:hypothetical protein
MLENGIAVVVSLIIAFVAVYIIDKKFGGPDDSETMS